MPWARGPRMLRNSVQVGLLLLERLLVLERLLLLEGLLMEGLLRGGPLLRSLLHPNLRLMRRRRPDLSLRMRWWRPLLSRYL